MSIHVVCEGCSAKFRLKDAAAGRTLVCKACGASISVPGRANETGMPPLSAGTSDVDWEDSADETLPPVVPRRAAGSGSGRPAPGSRYRKRRRSFLPMILLIGGGAFAGLVLIGMYAIDPLRNALQPEIPPVPPVSGSATELFPVATVPLPVLPPLGDLLPVPGSRVVLYDVNFADVNAGSTLPGSQGKMRLYIPPGSHGTKSLGCILVAPAGTNLLVGNNLDDPTYHAETVPYAEAGYAVLFYSLDGGVVGNLQVAGARKLADGYRSFHAAHAGVVNGRNALEFVLARVPQVDPERVFAAGHSSAGVLALLFAAHEPRLKGCIAYAAACDVETRLADVARDPAAARVFPGIGDFIRRSSPRTHLDKLDRPVFLFHAADDSNEPIATTEQFAADLQRMERPVTFHRALRGDHYQAMIDEGIPRAIDWLKQLPGESAPAQTPVEEP